MRQTSVEFLEQRQRGPIRSVLLVIIGCLIGWQRSFPRNGSKDFLIFRMRLGDYKGRKGTDPDF